MPLAKKPSLYPAKQASIGPIINVLIVFPDIARKAKGLNIINVASASFGQGYNVVNR